MALPGSGAISIGQIATEFGGGAPHSLNEYYRNGSRVPNYSQNSSIATSGAINMNSFHGASDVAPYANWSTTQTTGSRSSGKSWSEVGFYKGIFGSIDDTTVDGQSGTEITRAYYRTVPGGTSFLQLRLASGSNNWANFVVRGISYSRTSASKSGVVWTWNGVGNPYSSGAAGQRISIAINV